MSAARKTGLAALALMLLAMLPPGNRIFGASPDPAAAPPADLSGVWQPNPKSSGRWPEQRPFTKAMATARAQWDKDHTPFDLTVDDEKESCLPYTLPYMLTTTTTYPFEIVTTPRRVYFYKESYGQLRRIYMDGGLGAPRDPLASRTGISRGHWEGSQLVVESTNILPENEGSRYPSSPMLRVTERISVEQGGETGKQLIDEVTITDPLVYEKPIVIRMVYKSVPDIHVDEYICQQDLWDQHLEGRTNVLPWR